MSLSARGALHPQDEPDRREAPLSRVTEATVRRTALRLVAQRGYGATSIDDIAQAAGVSLETFFLYFPDKEAAVLFPDGLVAGLVLAALGERAPDDEPVVGLVGAIATAFDSLEHLIRQDDLFRTGLRVMMSEPELQRALLQRRLGVEIEAWAAMQRRGVPADDLDARVATAIVVTLSFLALQQWAASDGSQPLTTTLADCLLRAPEHALLRRGLAEATRR